MLHFEESDQGLQGYYVNSANPVQMLHFEESDQGLHCLLIETSM